MTSAMRTCIKYVDKVNYAVGRVIMYGIFLMVAILLWSAITKIRPLDLDPAHWTLEMAQFAMVGYYLLGGAYSIQLKANIRMDLFYGDWTEERKAKFDAFTVLFLVFYLGVLLYGGIDSTIYSYEYKQRTPSVWRPYIWPVKVMMCTGIFLMLLQAISEFFKDVLKLHGEAA